MHVSILFQVSSVTCAAALACCIIRDGDDVEDEEDDDEAGDDEDEDGYESNVKKRKGAPKSSHRPSGGGDVVDKNQCQLSSELYDLLGLGRHFMRRKEVSTACILHVRPRSDVP